MRCINRTASLLCRLFFLQLRMKFYIKIPPDKGFELVRMRRHFVCLQYVFLTGIASITERKIIIRGISMIISEFIRTLVTFFFVFFCFFSQFSIIEYVPNKKKKGKEKRRERNAYSVTLGKKKKSCVYCNPTDPL